MMLFQRFICKTVNKVRCVDRKVIHVQEINTNLL